MAANLLSLIPDGSSPAREVESEAAVRELVISTQPTQPSFTSEDSCPALPASRQGEGSVHLRRLALVRKDSRLAPRAWKKKKGSRQKVVGDRGLHSMGPSNIPLLLG